MDSSLDVAGNLVVENSGLLQLDLNSHLIVNETMLVVGSELDAYFSQIDLGTKSFSPGWISLNLGGLKLDSSSVIVANPKTKFTIGSCPELAGTLILVNFTKTDLQNFNFMDFTCEAGMSVGSFNEVRDENGESIGLLYQSGRLFDETCNSPLIPDLELFTKFLLRSPIFWPLPLG